MKLTHEQKIALENAKNILQQVMENTPVYQNHPKIENPNFAEEYVKCLIGAEEREQFVVLFLDNQHRLIKSEIMFQGTINQSTVYPREVIKTALYCNAAALLLAHNHPSGYLEPSHADVVITRKIQEAAELFDIRVLDHLIVQGTNAYSFAANDMM
ncbi:JAB domain-containing protein [[Pasteurella] aerogenes]